MLRLDWNILFNIINILILYFLMKRFLFKPVNEILAKRQAEADSLFAQAGEKDAKAQECREKYEALLQEAQSEKEKIVSDARKDASSEYSRILDEAKGKAEGLVEKAQMDAKKEKQAILQQADAEIQDMVLAAAARVAGAADGKENDRELYDRFLAKTAVPNQQ
ncbi:MAG: ATP synthase F0 subunit B [Lachnospiraceae bacterium]|nr:ATP synthase F0 subunit B [Lachnospiraceae bacterium]